MKMNKKQKLRLKELQPTQRIHLAFLDQYYEERACCGSREERRDFPTFEDWKRDQENPNWPR